MVNSYKLKTHVRLLLMVFIIAIGTINLSDAQTHTWRGDTGDQSWQDEQNWTGPAGIPNGPTANVSFVEASTASGGPLFIDLESATPIQLNSIRANGSTEAVTIHNSLGGPLELEGNGGAIANDILTDLGAQALTINADLRLVDKRVWINSGIDSGLITINGDIAPLSEPLPGAEAVEAPIKSKLGDPILTLTGRNIGLGQGIHIAGDIHDGDVVLGVDTGWIQDGANHRNTVRLTGQNTFTGGVNVLTNTLEFDSVGNSGEPSALGAGSHKYWLDRINLGANGFTGTARYVGETVTGHATDRNFHMASAGTGGGAIEASGAGPLVIRGGLTSNTGSNKQWRLAGESSGVVEGVVHDFAGAGRVNVFKDGDGTWTLAGANVYEGTTTVAQGELVLTGSIGNETLTADRIDIRSGATLTIDGGSARVTDLDNNGTLNLRSGELLLMNNTSSGGGGSVTIGTDGRGYLGLFGQDQTFDDVILSGSDDWLELGRAPTLYTFKATNLDNSAGGVILTSNSPTVHIDGGTFTYNVPVPEDRRFFRPQVVGSGGFTKQGDGLLVFDDNTSRDSRKRHTYTGDTRIEGGTLQVSGFARLPFTSRVFIAEDATLDLRRMIGDGSGLIGSLSGNGSVVTGSNVALSVGGRDDVFDGAISGEGDFVVHGPGTQELAGANTYSGITAVGGGTLRVTGAIQGTSQVSTSIQGAIEIDGGNIDTAGDLQLGFASPALRIMNGGVLKANQIDPTRIRCCLPLDPNRIEWLDGTIHLSTATELDFTDGQPTRQELLRRPFGASLTLDANRHLVVDENLTIGSGGSLKLEGGTVAASRIAVAGSMEIDSGQINGPVDNYGEITVNGTTEFGSYRGRGIAGTGTSIFNSDFQPADKGIGFEGSVVFADTSTISFRSLDVARISIDGSASLGGTLDVSFPHLPEGFVPDPFYTVLESFDLSGSFANVQPGERLPVENGTFLVSYGEGSEFDANSVVLSDFLLGILGDFDSNGILEVADINLLSANVGGTDDMFDLTNDGQITEADREFWVTDLKETFFGDADLNGTVEFSDFLTLSGNFGESGGWEHGDFDGSGLVDFTDFLRLSANFGQSDLGFATAVPEPHASDFLGLGSVALLICTRRTRSRAVTEQQ